MKNNAARTSRRKSRRKNNILTILATITLMLTMTLAGTFSGFAEDGGGGASDPLSQFGDTGGNMYPFLPGHAPDTNSPDDQDMIQGDDDTDGQTAGTETNNGQDLNAVENPKAETPKVETGKKAATSKAAVRKTSAAKLAAVKIIKPKAVKKGFTVKWKKIKKSERKFVKRIEIQYSKDKNFKSGVKTVYAGAKNASKKIKGVKKGKYYVRVRACAKPGVKVKTSEWSIARPVRVK
jgi:hypothetical protein